MIPCDATATADNLKTASDKDDDDDDPWRWAIIGAVVGLCMGIAIGISLMFLAQRGVRSWRDSQAKKNASSPGSCDPTLHNKRPSTNYTTLTNEIPISEYSESGAVNESFELTTGIKRTDSFTSL